MKRLLSTALLLLMIVVFGSPALTHAASTPPYGVDIVEDSLARHLMAGTSGYHSLRIYNTGTSHENFNVQISSTRGWFTTTGVNPTYFIAPGSYVFIQIPVSAPAGVAHGTYDTLTVTATSQSAPAVTASSLFFTRAVTFGDYSIMPQLGFAVSSYEVRETDGKIDVTVSALNGPVGLFASVDYATADGSAISECWTKNCTEDFVAKSGRLIFYPGESSKVITIDIIEDKALEPLQSFSIQLSHPLDSHLGSQASATVTIAD